MTWQFVLAGARRRRPRRHDRDGRRHPDDADPDPALRLRRRRSRSAPTSSTARSSSRSARPATGSSAPCTRGSRSGCWSARRRCRSSASQIASSFRDGTQSTLQQGRRRRADRRRPRVPREDVHHAATRATRRSTSQRRDKVARDRDRRGRRLRRRADLGRLRHVLRPRDAVRSIPLTAAEDRRHRHVPRRACCSGSPALGHLLHGNVDMHAMAWLLVGSIPGVLIGSHLSIRVPERALRIAFGFVLILSGIKLVRDARTRTTIIVVGLGARRDRAPRLVGPRRQTATAARAPDPPHTTPRRILRAWPGSSRPRSSSPCSRRRAAAFALTEGAKLELSPIYGTHVDRQVFSPACKLAAGRARSTSGCGTRERLDGLDRRRGTASASRRWSPNRTFPSRGRRSTSCGTASPTTGLALPDGVYRPVVKLARSHRTITLPNPIQLDTKPPAITVQHPHLPAHLARRRRAQRRLPRPLHARTSRRTRSCSSAAARSRFTRTQQADGRR